jgi:hypothetical protein
MVMLAALIWLPRWALASVILIRAYPLSADYLENPNQALASRPHLAGE